MTKRKIWATLLLLGLCTFAGLGLSYAADDTVKTQSPEKLLPANAVVYIQYDGSLKHKKEWEQTAAYESLYKSGLMDVFKKVLEGVIVEARKMQGPGNNEKVKEELDENIKVAEDLFTTALQQGVSLAIALPEGKDAPPLPSATIVMKGLSRFEPKLKKSIEALFSREGIEIDSEKIKGRNVSKVAIPDSPGVEIGWWAEGDHLVIVIGINAINSAVDVAAGDAPNISTNPLYKKFVTQEVSFARDSISWFNVGVLRSKFGDMPLPLPREEGQEGEPKTVNDLLNTLGLHNLGACVSQSGYKGRSLWAEFTVETNGKRTGLLKMGESKPFKLSDLPPLPEKTHGFSAGTVDLGTFYEEALKLAINLTAYIPEREAGKILGVLNGIPDVIGFDPQEEIFDNFGSINCMYDDPGQGMYGIGTGAVIQVKNPEKLRAGLNHMLELIKKQDKENLLTISRSQKQGREIVHLFMEGVPIGPAYCVDDKWMVVGIMPQTVEAFLLRLDGKLKSWKPTEQHLKALAELPKDYTSLTMMDPKQSYQMILGIAPLYLGFAEVALRQEMRFKGKMPFKVSDLPPAELVVKPMYPNFIVGTSSEAGFKWTSRSSVPTNPLGVSSVAGVGIAVALLLPAVQQARSAARRSQYRPKEYVPARRGSGRKESPRKREF